MFYSSHLVEGRLMTACRIAQSCALVLVFLLASFSITGCPDTPDLPDLVTEPITTSKGMINASLSRYIESGTGTSYEQFGLTGIFARYDIEQANTVEDLLNGDFTDVDLALDSCSFPAPILEDGSIRERQGRSAIELLDVGDLTVSYGGRTKTVPTRTFPDLLRIIVGVMYTADESKGVQFRPAETYSLRAAGTEDVSRFRVSLESPEDMGDVKIDGINPGDQLPMIRKGEDVELVWEGDGYGDEIVATLNWTSMGAPWSMTCRLRDDGLFVIPSVYTLGLPDPLTSSDEEMMISRVRQVAFRSAGLTSGSFRFIVSANFSVSF